MPLQKIDDILAKPISLWVISLIVAMGLWFYVAGREDTIEKQRTVACKIEFLNLASQLEIKTPTSEVWVDVFGSESDIDRLSASDIICEVDTRGLAAGRYRLSVRTTIPTGLRLREVRPSQIDVELLRYADRLIPIEVVLPNELPEGTYLDSVEIIPKEITVRGVERDLAKIGGCKIFPTADELQSGKELLLTPEVERSSTFDEKVSVEPAQVRFKAVLARGNPKRMVPVNARIVGAPSDDYVVQSTTIDPAEMLVEGPKNALDKIRVLDTERIDISGISESKSMVVRVRPPLDVSLKIVGEHNVKVSIALQPRSATKEIVNVPVRIEGASSNWGVSPNTVTITIEGLPSVIGSSDISSVDVSAVVNAENLFTPKAVVPVRARITSDSFKIIKVDPATVSLVKLAE